MDRELFSIDPGNLVGEGRFVATARNEATRELCRAYLASGARLLAKRRMELAVEHIEEAIRLARTNHDRLGEGAGLGLLGSALFRWDDIEQAIGCYEQALEIARETGGPKGQGYILFNMSLAWEALDDRVRAVEYAQAALSVLEPFGDAAAAHVRAQLAQWQGETR